MASSPIASDPAAQAARDLLVMFSRLRRRMRELAATEDLTPSQASVLRRLEKDGHSSTSRLALTEGVRPQSMAATVAALEERGLIERRHDPEDGRRQIISLTAAGIDRVKGDRHDRGEWLAQTLYERYTAEQLAVITEALRLLEELTES
jgi:DNA-binding MarR family transcriptional regulator